MLSGYVTKTEQEIGIPNIVTAVLASFRGYDTLGETIVVFTAGIGVLMLLARSKRQRLLRRIGRTRSAPSKRRTSGAA